MKFISILVFMFFWHLLIYCPIAHWEWGGGFMGAWGVLDFAGGDVVHISSGVSGLVGSVILGPRKSFKSGEAPAHNVLLTFIGASLLWVGWFGFNAGSALAAGSGAGMAMLVTHIAASTAGLSWMTVEWLLKGKPTVLGIVSGGIAGLVVITPGAGYVDQTGAFFMGLFGGVACYFGIQLKNALGFDDALDAFGVHGIGGAVLSPASRTIAIWPRPTPSSTAPCVSVSNAAAPRCEVGLGAGLTAMAVPHRAWGAHRHRGRHPHGLLRQARHRRRVRPLLRQRRAARLADCRHPHDLGLLGRWHRPHHARHQVHHRPPRLGRGGGHGSRRFRARLRRRYLCAKCSPCCPRALSVSRRAGALRPAARACLHLFASLVADVFLLMCLACTLLSTLHLISVPMPHIRPSGAGG